MPTNEQKKKQYQQEMESVEKRGTGMSNLTPSSVGKMGTMSTNLKPTSAPPKATWLTNDQVGTNAVGQPSDALASLQKPGEYQSPWQANLDDIINRIQNREKFSYDLNGDALYQQYKNQYMTQGQMAMMDTMGQAAAMTGGYGSSYAQGVGQQAYQGYLQQLNDRVPELYQLALDQYNREGDELYNQYGLIADRENTDYGRYRDTVSDYNTERSYLTDQYRYEKDFDYRQSVDDRNYAYQVARDAVSDDQWRQSFDYQKDRDTVSDSQWQSSFDYQKERDATSDSQWQQSFDYQKDRDATADKQWQSSFDYQKERDATSDSQWQQSFDYQKGRDAVEDSQWQQSFNYQKSQDAKVNSSKTPSAPTTTPPAAEPDYSSWTGTDWSNYFAEIRRTEGVDAAVKELAEMNRKGLIPKQYLSGAGYHARGSYGH